MREFFRGFFSLLGVISLVMAVVHRVEGEYLKAIYHVLFAIVCSIENLEFKINEQ